MSSGACFVSWCPQPIFQTGYHLPAHPTILRHSVLATQPVSSHLTSVWDHNVMSNPDQNENELPSKSGVKSASARDNVAGQLSCPASSPLHGQDNVQPSLNPRGPRSTAPNNSYFESRARALSPSMRLQNHRVANRDAKKQQLFSRLRNRRDDARFERNGDQMLRIDWVRERKAWEQEMEQSGSDILNPLFLEDLEELDNIEKEVESIPVEIFPMEEHETEGSVDYCEQMDEDRYSDPEDEYDAVFSELLYEQPTAGSVCHTGRTDTDTEMQ